MLATVKKQQRLGRWLKWIGRILLILAVTAVVVFWSRPLLCQEYFPLLGELLTERPSSDDWSAAEFGESPSTSPRLTSQDYFPELTFKLAVDGTPFMELALADELRGFGEESIYRRREVPSSHLYRLMWRRSFDPAIIVRLEIEADGTARLISRHFALRPVGKGKVTQWEKKLTRAQTSKFVERFERQGFWDSPSDDDTYGLDGSTWVFEGCRNGLYHVAKRWSPERGDPLKMLGLDLLESAGVWRGPVY